MAINMIHSGKPVSRTTPQFEAANIASPDVAQLGTPAEPDRASFWDRYKYNSAFKKRNLDNVELQQMAEQAKADLGRKNPPPAPLGKEELRAARTPATTQRVFDGFDSSRDLVGLYAREGKADEPYRIDLEVAHLRPAAEMVALDSTLQLSWGDRRVHLSIDNDHNILVTDAKGDDLKIPVQVHHSHTFNRVQVSVDKDALRGLGWKDGQPVLLEAATTPEASPQVTTQLVASSDAKASQDNIFRWEGKLVYYALTDRFHNGDTSNDGNVNKADPEAFHGGDWQGVIDKLDYLKDLNVDCIWLSPPYLNQRDFKGLDGKAAPKDGFHGYWPMSFTEPDPNYGDKAKLTELTEKAHAKGMKVMLDVVVNHTAYGHEWFKDPVKKEEWFHHDGEIRSYNQYDYEHGSLCGLPDLKQENPQVSKRLIEDHKEWLEHGVDAFRVDAARHVPEGFLRDFNNAMREDHPGYFAVGEVFVQDTPVVAGYQNRTIDSVFDFPLAYTIRNVFAGDPSRGLGERFRLFKNLLRQQPQEAIRMFLHSHKQSSMSDLSKVFANDSLYENPDKLGTLIDNHDMVRFMSDTGGHKEYLQLALAFLMAARGTPHVYYGTEVGMDGIGNQNRNDMEFGKDPALTDRFKAMTAARASSQALQHGHQVELLATKDTYALSRMLPDEEVVCLFNNSEKPRTLNFALDAESQIPNGAQLHGMLDKTSVSVSDEGQVDVTLPAKGYTYLRWTRPPSV